MGDAALHPPRHRSGGIATAGAVGLALLLGLVIGRVWTPPPAATAESGGDWQLTVYYTAVERYHGGAPQAVIGCLVLDCEHGGRYLGTYPSDFVQAVKDEGTGRIT